MQNRKYSLLFIILVFTLSFIGPINAFSEESPLCKDLARFSCSPGSYDDGTGVVKSDSEVFKTVTAYAEKSQAALRSKFEKVLSDPSNAYFKDLAIAGLGLKNSPQCASSARENMTACQNNLVDGLTAVAQKTTLGSLLPRTGLERIGNLRDLNYIVQNEVYQKVIREMNDKTKRELGNPAMERKIQDKIFPKVKELIIARLKQLPVSEEQRNFMISKVSSIAFDGTTCDEFGGSKGRRNGEIVSSLLIPNAFYNTGRNTFKYCSGLLIQSNSEFQIVNVIAHELSHSIDPCNIARGPADMGFKYSYPQDIGKMESEYPIKNILSCLRDERSVGAQNFTLKNPGDSADCGNCDYPSAPNEGSGKGGGGYVRYDSKLPPKEAPKANFCDKDQIGESFSDWMATEILPTYIEQNYKLTREQYQTGYANAWRLLCRIEDADTMGMMLGSRSEHPAAEKRINNMQLVNPKVRVQMGCSPKHPDNIYCDPEKPVNAPAIKLAPAKPDSQTDIEGAR